MAKKITRKQPYLQDVDHSGKTPSQVRAARKVAWKVGNGNPAKQARKEMIDDDIEEETGERPNGT